MIRRGVRARIRGREIGKGLVDIVKRLRVQRIEEVAGELDRYHSKEMTKLLKRDPHLAKTKLAQLQDNVDTINTLAETVASVDELMRKLEMLFNDETGAASVMCSTVHKAKGLEADRVWVLWDTFTQGGIENENLRYVAITRARRELCFVTTKGGEDERAVIEQPTTHDVG